MPKLRDILKSRETGVLSVEEDATVADALAMMANHNVGSLLVMTDGLLSGIITERHFARKVFLAGNTSPDTKVGDVMTKNLIVGRPDMDTEEALALMADQRFRHLPVCEDDTVLGMVTMTDLVQGLLGAREFTIRQLENYVYRRSD